MRPARPAAALLAVLALLGTAACGGSGGKGGEPAGTPYDPGTGYGEPPGEPPGTPPADPPPTPPPSAPPPPGTPPLAPVDPDPPPTGGSGSNRWQMGAAEGLFVVDPAAGEAAVQGFVVVTLASAGGALIPPDGTTVTLNGVALLRDPALDGSRWRVDPAGPQPVAGRGGRLVIVASATVESQRVERTLVLPCPDAIPVTSSPAAGAALAPAPPPALPLRLTSAETVTLNTGIAALTVAPTATLWGYQPATRALVPSGSPQPIGPGPLDVALPVLDTAAPAWLLDLRWPGPWISDGESGGFCGLALRWTYGR